MSVGFIIMRCPFVNQHNRTNIPIDIEAKSVSSSENLQMKQIILNLLRSVNPPHGAALLLMHLKVLLICPSSKVTRDLRSVIRHQRCSSFTPWHTACSATHHFAAITPNTPLSSFSASLWCKGGTKKHGAPKNMLQWFKHKLHIQLIICISDWTVLCCCILTTFSQLENILPCAFVIFRLEFLFWAGVCLTFSPAFLSVSVMCMRTKNVHPCLKCFKPLKGTNQDRFAQKRFLVLL